MKLGVVVLIGRTAFAGRRSRATKRDEGRECCKFFNSDPRNKSVQTPEAKGRAGFKMVPHAVFAD